MKFPEVRSFMVPVSFVLELEHEFDGRAIKRTTCRHKCSGVIPPIGWGRRTPATLEPDSCFPECIQTCTLAPESTVTFVGPSGKNPLQSLYLTFSEDVKVAYKLKATP